MKGGKKKSSVSDAAAGVTEPSTLLIAGGGGEVVTLVDGGSTVTTEERKIQEEEEEEGGDGDDDGDEEEEEEGDEEAEEGGEKGYDRFENLLIQEAEAEAEVEVEVEDERPKLAEGFYEIEAVRRKRVRKGKVQYLIKWRGWPEAANTWEPLENLASCSDVIQAFDESLQSGKHRSARRRKRKCGVSQTQSKKKQHQRSPAAATYNVPAVKVRIIEEPLPFPSFSSSTMANKVETNAGRVDNNSAVLTKCTNDSDYILAMHQAENRNEQNELDMKLSELKGIMIANEGSADKVTVQYQDSRVQEGHGSGNGLLKVDGVEPIRSGRCTGAKRRKSGSVKRFKQDPTIQLNDDAQNVTRTSYGTTGIVGHRGVQNPEIMGNDIISKNKLDTSKNMCSITEIIKPISYSASVSNNIQDVSVTFLAMRSDGKQVMVDNKFLKANNPHLLINFYEQHLRYSPT